MTQTASYLVCFLLVTLANGVEAAEPVRRYMDPGYHRIGVYAGGPPEYFDYSLSKSSLGDTFKNKKAYWAERLKAFRARQRGGQPNHTIHTVFCGIRDGQPFEVCRRRIDAWLKPEPGIPTYPETIPAICLEEENITSRSPLMDRLARHIRDNYGIPVFQWYSDPLGPSTSVTADGWVWDSYGWSPERFRRHVMGFVILGKPVICVPWASDPHWPQWTQYPSTQDMINREWHQFTTCMEFNVSTAPFCVAGPGAINPWLGSMTPDMLHLRRALKAKRRQMHALPRGVLPLPSANYSQASRQVPVGGDSGSPSRYHDDFGTSALVHDASVTGFLDLMLTSRPAEPGFLVVRPRPGPGARRVQRPVTASLTYHLDSYFPLKSLRVTLKGTAPVALGAINSVSLLSSEWNGETVTRLKEGKSSKSGTLAFAAGPNELKGAKQLSVRVEMSQKNGDSHNLSHRIDDLVIEAEHVEPAAGSAAQLVSDDYGNLSYDDDFTTERWAHLGTLSPTSSSHFGRRETGFWIGLKGGTTLGGSLTQRFTSPRALKELEVKIRGYANGPDLGGSLTLEVAPRGQAPIWRLRSQGRHSGPMTIKIPTEDLTGDRSRVSGGLTDFDVRVTLHSASGVEQGQKACATLDSLSIRGR